MSRSNHNALVFRTLTHRLSWVGMAVVAILVGLLMNMGIAWICAATSRLHAKEKIPHKFVRIHDGRVVGFVGQKSLVETRYHWGFDPPPNTKAAMAHSITDADRALGLPRWGPLAKAFEGYPNRVVGSSFQVSYGLPLRSMYLSAETELRGRDVYSNALRPQSLISSKWWGGTQAGLPLGIVAVGMIANTLFIGVIYCLAYIALKYVCMSTRIYRGKCPVCRYEMGEMLLSAGCPECGWGRGR